MTDARTRVEIADGVAHLILDDPDRKVNTLGREMLAEIGERVETLAGDAAVRAIVIRSGKTSGFIAGADIGEIQDIAFAPDVVARGLQASRAGQALMNRVADCPKPVVAAIHGACLGGGLELALACHGRVASSDAGTKLGLPELKLGIVPGFGGTWRLPRLIGFTRGLEAILSSRSFDSRQAFRMGLVDDRCFEEQLPQVAAELAHRLADPRGRRSVEARRRQALPFTERLLGLPGLRGLVAGRARRQVLAKTRGSYPAPVRAVSTIAESFGRDRSRALAAEAQALADTLATRVAVNLLRLFFLSQAAKKQTGDAKGTRVRTAGVLGSGLMGSGIALALTGRPGMRTTLKDAALPMLGKALKKAWEYHAKRVRRRQLDEVEALRRFHLLSVTTDYGGFRDADLVIEAVPEILELKRQVLAEVVAAVPPTAVVASNTSSLPIGELAAGAARPERFIGMHFFMPAEIMPLVEVIPGAKTSRETVATVVELALAMDKVPVVVKDRPGFLVNRILCAYMLEAAQMVEEGVSASRVDRAAVAFGMPVGPVRLVGEVGVEVMRKVLHVIQGAFGKDMAAPQWIDRDDLGKAFTRTSDGKWRVEGDLIAGWVGKHDPGYADDVIRDRLFTALLNESVRCLDEGVVASAGLLDLAMVYGIGFPPFRGGPLSEADARGLAEVARRAGELAERFGRHLAPSPRLAEMSSRGETFHPVAAQTPRQ